MIRVKDHQTGYLFDPWGHLGPKRRKLLDESWAGLFRRYILEELPVNRLASMFREDFGRPTKELYTALGVVVLQQMLDLTDEETVDLLAFNTQWHYALDISDESDEAKYMGLKTLWNVRHRVTVSQLDTEIFELTTDKLAKVFEVETGKQRLDSVHIRSNMQKLGRLRLFGRTIKRFLNNLKRQHPELFSELDGELIERYFPENGEGCFARVKPSESQKRLGEVARDLYDLVERFLVAPEVCTMSSFKYLVRVLEEQCEVRKDEVSKKVEVIVKPPREVPSDSLQNPSDPDATYDGHKGQGYQVQVMETYSEEEDEQKRKGTLNLITYVQVETACLSDAHALIPALESVKERDLSPQEVLADTLYGSDNNCAAAQDLEVELVAPSPGRQSESDITLGDFEFTESGRVAKCPSGQAPERSKYNGRTGQHAECFDDRHCNRCPKLDQCPTVQ